MSVNPRSLENLLNMPRLEAGVTSEVHRVRASAEVQAWFRRLSAEERGKLLTRLMAAPGSVLKGELQQLPGVDIRRPDLSGLRQLQVVSSVLPSALKNALRWSPDRYADLEAVLRQTQALRLDRSNGKAVWRTDDGSSMRKDTVKRLLGAGLLVDGSG